MQSLEKDDDAAARELLRDAFTRLPTASPG
jgi:hypothetical protein